MPHHARGVTSDPQYRTEIKVDGHGLTADEPPALGGQNAGPSPFGLVMAGLVACTATTLRMYAQHKGWAGVGIAVDLALDTSGARPAIHRQVDVTGAPDEAALQRLRDVVERTPVTLALKSGFDIETKLQAAASETAHG